jgi:hypothetical protein
MTKLSIEIDDISDERACVASIGKLFSVLRESHGHQRTDALWRSCYDPADPADPAEVEFLLACRHFILQELRLVLEYYAMAKPSKLGLAKELARRNETLRPKESYGPNGTTDEDTMHQQIKRVFRRDKEAFRIIGEATTELREERLRWANRYCRKWAVHWAEGERGTPERAQRRYRRRVGHKSK